MGDPNQQSVIPAQECDVVMKGGITSGVVYPSAVLRLSERYRFRNVGGASVGAIAAAITAAAEFGRLTGKGTGFEQLSVINGEMRREGFLLSLFKPRPSARGLYSIYLSLARKEGMIRAAATVIRQAPWVLLLMVGWWVSLVLSAAWLAERWWLVPALVGGWAALISVLIWTIGRRVGWAGPAGGILLSIGWPLLFALASVGLSGWRDLSDNGFGLVPGSSPDGNALCDWLHRHIQRAAGLSDNEPLTFGMLRNHPAKDGQSAGIGLHMMTTNLSISRPMRLPKELVGYAFSSEDLDGVLPDSVIQWLKLKGTREGHLFRLPREDDVPVLLAFRLSLSFPLLFTAVRLRTAAAETLTSDPVAHWFSDGGIASNFPVHIFDAWMPGRPTFALSFAPFPVTPDGRLLHAESDVGLPPAANGSRLPRWVDISHMGGFAAQILETMQNWRDTLQSELPGFRDRVYEARLDKDAGEGGLNLGMDTATIERLQGRGERVAGAILDTFDWNQHFFNRYVVAKQQLEIALVGGNPAGLHRGSVKESFSPRRASFAAGEVGAGELFGRDAAWLRSAGDATWSLVIAAERWADFGRYASDIPRPQPVMRLVPDV
jgi:predicted acylesterase/phospholipase RssA